MGYAVSLKSQSFLEKRLFINSTGSLFHTTSNSFLSSPMQESNAICMRLSPLTHVAFFCKMEDKVYNRLNVWIKLRAGSDEIYRKMIATP
jgi:hypothetical protein